jgi:DNA-binding beta-propeller fold protein YncE
MSPPRRLARRSFLLGALGVTLAACGPASSGSPGRAPTTGGPVAPKPAFLAPHLQPADLPISSTDAPESSVAVATAAAPDAPERESAGRGSMALVWQSDGDVEHLVRPAGLAAERQGTLLVLDAGRDRIVRLEQTTGHAVAAFGGPGGGAGQFRFAAPPAADRDESGRAPAGQLASDADGQVYVADALNRRVQVLDSDGRPVESWAIPSAVPGPVAEPHAVAVDGQGVVTIVDRWSHRVYQLDRRGRLLRSWGGLGTEAGAFTLPLAAAADRRGQVYLVDAANQRLQVFDREGRFITAWGAHGSEAGEFLFPVAVAVDAANRVYVADTAALRIQVFTDAGVFLGAWGEAGVGPGQFATISGIAVDDEGAVYVADKLAGRVQKFQRRAPWPVVAGTPTPRPATPTPLPGPTATVSLMTPTDR